MNPELISYLKTNIGSTLTSEIAADICILADKIPGLVSLAKINKIKPESNGNFVFAVGKMQSLAFEIYPLHRAHWLETEGHRHGIELKPDYDTFIRYEKAGRYILFTMRRGGVLVGNCAMYLDLSTHTKTLIATEDTLFIMPEARRGRIAHHFVAYVENSLKQIGVKEISITVKTVNKAGRFFGMLGYCHVENGFTKVLEGENVQSKTAEA